MTVGQVKELKSTVTAAAAVSFLLCDANALYFALLRLHLFNPYSLSMRIMALQPKVSVASKFST